MRRVANTLHADQRGYSLVELLVVMVILSLVLAGLAGVFVSGSTAEVRFNQRFQAQQQARLALDRIRGDIHCASHAQVSPINSLPALRLNVASCSATAPYDYWCVATVSTSPPRYQLYRATSTVAPTSSTCTSSDTSRTLVADHLVSSSAFTTSAIPLYGLQTVGVDFKVSIDPRTATPTDVYELSDSIVARNYTPRCTSSSTTWFSASSTCSVT
ncbi:MAG TPA: type II secretion system protein, partial [Gaiellaceae bacterium]|nr:type II secretion system protein [Gaiellaceae bacterium]